jgi:phosphate transport system protein
MPHAFEAPLAQIRESLLLMHSLATRVGSDAMRALVERDDALADSVEASDSEIDGLEIAIDEQVIAYMATRGPVATDCRFMLCASKISSNLERIADEATTIARRAIQLNREPLLKPLIDIPLMGDIAQEMLRDGMAAYLDGNAETAIEIIARDKSVDAIYKQLVRELTTCMMEDPKAITRCLHLMTIAKSIERIADHASNIAEDVYYLYSGRDIRHEHGQP